MSDFTFLPDDLPVPHDDGAADHLEGVRLPSLEMDSTHGRQRLIADTPWTILYVYPRTGGPGVDLPDGWDLIPGARGCTPQGCAFRDHAAELAGHGAAIRGLSAQSFAEQRRFSERMHIPFPLMNDSGLLLAGEPLRLPTYPELGLYKRLTMAIRAGVVRRVWYPVFPPDQNATDVLSYLTGPGATVV